jgi:hypothetical protein
MRLEYSYFVCTLTSGCPRQQPMKSPVGSLTMWCVGGGGDLLTSPLVDICRSSSLSPPPFLLLSISLSPSSSSFPFFLVDHPSSLPPSLSSLSLIPFRNRCWTGAGFFSTAVQEWVSSLCFSPLPLSPLFPSVIFTLSPVWRWTISLSWGVLHVVFFKCHRLLPWLQHYIFWTPWHHN